MRTREQEAGGEAEGRSGSGWKGPKGKRTGPGREGDARVVGEVRGSERGDPLGPVAEDAWLPGRNRAAVGGVEGSDQTEVRDNSWRRPEKEAAG